MKDKKGAIELSMTTIIVIIIGLVLLSLGLSWVRGVFTKITDLSEQAFALSDQEIMNMFSESSTLLKVLPDSVDLKKGKTATVGVIVTNLESDRISFKVKTESINKGIKCLVSDTLKTESNQYMLTSGSIKKLKLKAITSGGTPLGLDGCSVELIGISSVSGYSTSDSLTVNVVK